MFIHNLHMLCSGCSDNQDAIMRNKERTLRAGRVIGKDLEKDFDTLPRLMMRPNDKI